MSVTGIISEYNPFHNGHKYNLKMARNNTGSDCIISIMSGSFLQRGEPAIFDKWSRAKAAVSEGVDLVIELPVIYSCQPAENFAYGAVKILNSLGIVDYLCFGSESGNINELMLISDTLLNEPISFKNSIKKSMNQGISYPKAISEAIKDSLGLNIAYPNNILGIEYLKAISKLKSDIKPVTIKRIKNDYNETSITGSVSSATAIREEMKLNGLNQNVCLNIPEKSLKIISENTNNRYGPVYFEDFSDLIFYQLRKSGPAELSKLPYFKEGIEYRLKSKSNETSNLNELIESVKSKRYTRTYLQRILCYVLLGITKSDVLLSKNSNSQSYARVLAFNKKGRELLREMKKHSSYPIITKTSNFRTKERFVNRMLALDTLSTDIYNMAVKNPDYKKPKQDYLKSPYYIDDSENVCINKSVFLE